MKYNLATFPFYCTIQDIFFLLATTCNAGKIQLKNYTIEGFTHILAEALLQLLFME